MHSNARPPIGRWFANHGNVFSETGKGAMLTDRALRGLASIRPKSLAEAEGIPGIGPVKLHAVVLRLKRRRLEEWGNDHDGVSSLDFPAKT